MVFLEIKQGFSTTVEGEGGGSWSQRLSDILEVGGDGGAGGLGQVDHVLAVGLGGRRGLLSVPDGLHLGVVGAHLVLSGLVGGEPLAAPPDTGYQSSPSAGLDEGRHTDRFREGHC